MKQPRNAADLAAALTSAALAPVPLPSSPAPALKIVSTTKAAKPKSQDKAKTVAMTLRPSEELLKKYTLAAANRTRDTGRVASAQEIMLEILEKHAP